MKQNLNRLWVDIPQLGFSFDDTLFWHFLRDMVFSATWAGIMFLVSEMTASTDEVWEIMLSIGAWMQFGFALGYEGRERDRFFGIGDFAISIVAVNFPLAISCLVKQSWYSCFVVTLNVVLMVVIFVLVVTVLFLINLIVFKRGLYKP